nr:PREDICTED: senecionine N-oxygenase-like [Bemisia tabaci]XP_018900371.1 PREDICTED: senecionine N-oxygenase-like [Bemisia tabaci]XP_018900372.1 PREDICTED: senecionine N-oxygenase-like [Bemisia tabaci]XP_018900373.1 PREDICTED: senecionine N-oxygenase-like [Bemisia tabaci]
MQVAVIGAGAAGLVVGRRLVEDMPGADFTIFEQTDSVGGTWVYTEEQFKDKYGLPIHSSMYKSLRTNLPKETMEYFGFPYDKTHEGISYLNAADIVRYLEQFAKHFELIEKIKFNHHVTSVMPLPNNRWQITVTDLPKDSEKQFEFDAIFVCNGHLHRPNHIKIEGQDVFSGFQLHSHHYRKPDAYKDKNVLVIGSGPSGTDISVELSNVAQNVYLSHHDPTIDQIVFPEKVTKKPDVLRLNNDSVDFVDGSTSHIDAILYCTGYKMNMPFLTPECGLEITDRSVSPLFFHMVNINIPTMFFIGLVNKSFLFPLFEMQAEFCTKTLNGYISLPPKEDMLKWWQAENSQVQLHQKKPHYIGNAIKEYHDFIHKFANTNIYDPVVFKIYKDSSSRKKSHMLNYRSDVYTVIDVENFRRINLDGIE